jgi:hypothetical protein
VAQAILGDIRDEALLLRALAADAVDGRLEAVAGLAFLQTEKCRQALRSTAQTDPRPGVRELALWGYGFAGAPDAEPLAESVASEDPDAMVRAMATGCLTVVATDVRKWWGV